MLLDNKWYFLSFWPQNPLLNHHTFQYKLDSHVLTIQDKLHFPRYVPYLYQSLALTYNISALYRLHNIFLASSKILFLLYHIDSLYTQYNYQSTPEHKSQLYYRNYSSLSPQYCHWYFSCLFYFLRCHTNTSLLFLRYFYPLFLFGSSRP